MKKRNEKKTFGLGTLGIAWNDSNDDTIEGMVVGDGAIEKEAPKGFPYGVCQINTNGSYGRFGWFEHFCPISE